MIEELRPNLFRIEIPLPGSPLKYLNSYVVRSNDKNLIIDTGLNQKECLIAMHAGLQQIGVSLDRTDIFITHLHADHFSLVSELATPDTTVWFNRPDAEIVESWEGLEWMVAYSGRHGFPEDRLKAALDTHPGAKFGSGWIPELKILGDGATINYGEYSFTCIETSGHTMGHTCLYEPDKKILISGDHILIDITPNIQCWSDERNPLKEYLESLEKVYDLDVDLVLPGHRRIFHDHRRRIRELQAHHRQRLSEVMEILLHATLSAYDTASMMTWDLKADSWDAFPVAQQWFATGEALAHLQYLEKKGLIRRHTVDGIIRFSRNNSERIIKDV
jgi:glyoxylase-like metal-dependent hydrolase (beta-lactamase superfamily II)